MGVGMDSFESLELKSHHQIIPTFIGVLFLGVLMTSPSIVLAILADTVNHKLSFARPESQ